MKILNLYAGIGGNRKLWGDEHEITAVENVSEIAEVYGHFFPNDIVIVADAHQYLIDHHQEFDFIWSSPPCPTHSRARFWGIGANGTNPCYPDMTLYQEIIFLQHHFLNKWVVENVTPYYEPLIPAQKRGRHLYWTNFNLPSNINERNFLGLCQRTKTNKYKGNELDGLCEFHNYDFKKYKGSQRLIKVARNLVDYEAAKTIFETALGIINKSNNKQISMFEDELTD